MKIEYEVIEVAESQFGLTVEFAPVGEPRPDIAVVNKVARGRIYDHLKVTGLTKEASAQFPLGATVEVTFEAKVLAEV